MSIASPETLKGLMATYFNEVKGTDRIVSSSYKRILNKTLKMFAVDYPEYECLDNQKKILCTTYPTKIPLPHTAPRRDQSSLEDLYELYANSSNTRARTRFVVPVMSYKDKMICRSGSVLCCQPTENVKKDSALLKKLKISTVSNFMVYDRSNPSSKILVGLSEKEPEIKHYYSDVKLEKLPIRAVPNLKCFASYNYDFTHYMYKQLETIGFLKPKIDLSQHLVAPNNDQNAPKHINFMKLIELYFERMIQILKDPNETGLLIHCLSGWDRTPLFISMIRLSLWADGLLHSHFSAKEMAYFLVSYDWYLFYHRLRRRLQEKAELIHFVVYMMQFLTDSKFSLNNTPQRVRKLKFEQLYNEFLPGYSSILPLVKINDPPHFKIEC
ncbi:myotubularin-related protein [Anaeramoeba flamelloides]|uniref:Myotubularin-related protein n=1 Tax=Anaeramoeba flamelloides TaxID=1746091 RepID=A0AAV8A8L6_9EUKA|nr:myotubularin-related protein [Anaeramoeba flamelloides]